MNLLKKTTTKYNINDIAHNETKKKQKEATQNTESPYKDTVETPFGILEIP